jgi:Zn-dependent protease with chaperone function
MKGRSNLDIYRRRSRNRLRLTVAIASFAMAAAAVSGLTIYILYLVIDLDFNPWVLISLFWLAMIIYAITRYALGGRWVFGIVRTLPPAQARDRLQSSLESVVLAAGLSEKVRLMVIPSHDINAFSLSLPDGSFALFATTGMADKLTSQQREAIMAHEIAHMQCGDIVLYTVMLRFTSWNAIKVKFRKHGSGGFSSLFWVAVLALSFAAVCLFLIYATAHSLDREMYSGYFKFDLWLPVVILFLVIAISLPYLLKTIMRLVLDGEREYYADMEAAYLTRDPACVYNALRSAAEDVIDLLVLPPSLDALLFHPIVDYASYRPFRTQPTMSERMRRLDNAFPAVNLASCAKPGVP